METIKESSKVAYKKYLKNKNKEQYVFKEYKM